MGNRTCSVDGCGRKHFRHGYCVTHMRRSQSGKVVDAPIRLSGLPFWERVDQSGGPDACHPWTGALNAYGYGVAWDSESRRTRLAHRAAWRLTHGPIPEGMDVLHHCDNPPCCNAHRCLFIGTAEDNIRDMIAKGRGRGQFTQGHQPIR